jgi:hypothetical protein
VSITITIKYQHSLKMALKTFTTADGSANQALVTNGSGVLSFAAVGASAGQVIQVLSATDITERNTSSTSFITASNTLSVTITPSSASNKIFVIVTAKGEASLVASQWTIYRGSTNLSSGTAGMITLAGDAVGSVSMSYLDSPATTSATTYQVYMRVNAGGGTVYLNTNSSRGSITCFEIKG